MARDEEPESTTQESMLNYVRLADGGVPAVDGAMRSEVTIVADLARRILPPFSVAPGEFRLMTVRSEGQFNSVVYDEEDLYRGNRRRDVAMMNGDDARIEPRGSGSLATRK
jgi:hypothetical protein